MTGKYEVGTISKLLFSSADDNSKKSSKKQAKLAKLFGSSPSSVQPKFFRTVKVSESDIFKKKDDAVPENKTTKVKKDTRIKKNKELAVGKLEEVVEKVGGNKKVKKQFGGKVPLPNKKLKNGIAKSKEGTRKVKKEKKKKPKHAARYFNKQEIEDEAVEAEPAEVKMEEDEDDKDDDDSKTIELTQNVKEEKDPDSAAADQPQKKSLKEQNTPKPKDEEREKRTIFVGNLTTATSKKDLKKIFQKYGKIETIRFRGGAPSKPTMLKKVAINKKELHPDKSTISAYIRFSNETEADIAVSKSRGLILDSHHVVIDNACTKDRDNKKTIFVGNLHLKLTDEELWQFFEDCGNVVSVRVVRDNATGLGKGFGYVNFDSRDAVDKAIKDKNQSELKNRQIRISRCVKKEKKKKDKKGKQQGGKKGEAGKGNKKGFGFSFRKGPSFSGDKLSEIGKLKRKSHKPNRGDMKKNKIIRILGNKKKQK